MPLYLKCFQITTATRLIFVSKNKSAINISCVLGHSQIRFIRSSSCPICNVPTVAYDVQRLWQPKFRDLPAFTPISFALSQVLSESRRRVAKTKTAASCATAISATDDKNSSKIGSTSDDLCEASDGIMKGVKNWSRHEIQMFKTSIWIIVFFSFCWIPYGILVVLQDLAPIALKQVRFSFCPSQGFRLL